MNPKRIQRKRIKGWRMPENIVYVGRPSKWGNPMYYYDRMIYIDASYRRKIFDKWVILIEHTTIEKMLSIYKELFNPEYEFARLDLDVWHKHFLKLDTSELKSKNLCCWCPLDQPCHADILLELANK